jgi:hypothetical protein
MLSVHSCFNYITRDPRSESPNQDSVKMSVTHVLNYICKKWARTSSDCRNER